MSAIYPKGSGVPSQITQPESRVRSQRPQVRASGSSSNEFFAQIELKLGLPDEYVSNRASQPPVPGDPRGVDHAGRASHRSSVDGTRRAYLLPGVLRSRLSRDREAITA